jgi:hypothetical protein
MTTVILLAASILTAAIVAWLLRRRLAALTLAYLPRKETMRTAILLTSIGLLAISALLPDLIFIASLATRKLRFVTTMLALSAALCIGCSKPAEPPKPHEIKWRGPETGYTATTPLPPDNAGKEAL